MTIGFAGTSFLTAETRWLIYIVYGGGVGMGCGFAYNAWLSNVLPWFPDKRGMASGVLLLGMGFTGFTLMMFVVAPWLENPDLGWRFSFRIIAIAALVIGLLGQLFIKKPDNIPAAAASSSAGPEITPMEMLKTGAFWYFTGLKSLIFAIGLSVTGAVALIVKVSAPIANPALDTLAITSMATSAVAAFSMCNGLSRPLMGVIFDKFKAVRSMLLVGVILIVASIALCFVYDNAIILTIVFLAVVAFCYGSSTALSPSFISSVFGQKHYRANNGIQSLSAIPFTILGSQGISAVYDSTGSYMGFFYIMIGCAVLTLAFALLCGKYMKKLAV